MLEFLSFRGMPRVVEIALRCLLFTPLCVLFQVAVNGVLDNLFLSQVSVAYGLAVTLLVGVSIEFAFSYWQSFLHNVLLPKWRYQGFLLASLHNFFIGVANVLHYRALNDAYFIVLGKESYVAVEAVVTTTVILMAMRCVRNIMGPPLSVGADAEIDNVFPTSTMFAAEDKNFLTFLADNASTVLVLGSLCFMHWITLTAFFDTIIYPDDVTMSIAASLIAGFFIVCLAFILNSRIIGISHSMDDAEMTKTIFESFFLVASSVGVILIWRGYWIIFERMMYYYPIYHFDMDFTAFYGVFFSYVMVCFMGRSNSLIAKGCDVDGMSTEGSGVSFGIDPPELEMSTSDKKMH